MSKKIYYSGNLLRLDDNGTTKTLRFGRYLQLTFLHLFENGSVLFATQNKCYYSHDWETFHRSTVIDIDGNVYDPTGYDIFACAKPDGLRQIVDGSEIKVWGNYSVEPGTVNENINVWCTTDFGETVKSIYKFRDSPTGTGSLYTRHVHRVNFNPANNIFYIQTGDHIVDGVDQSHVIEATYTPATDTWNFTTIGSGNAFKWLGMDFIGDYVYFSHDISPDGGLRRVLLSEIADSSKHEKLFDTPNDCQGTFVKGTEVIVLINVWGGTHDPRKFWYSPDLTNFHEITMYPEGVYDTDEGYPSGFRGIVNGRLVTNFINRDVVPNRRDWDLTPSLELLQFVRTQGFPNAFT